MIPQLSTVEIIRSLCQGKCTGAVRNCHLPNVHSMALRERLDGHTGMARVFYADKGHPLKSMFGADGDFTIMPHNHRQHITIELLFGKVYNLRYQKTSQETGFLPVYEYWFDSPLLGGSNTFQPTTQNRLSAPVWEELALGVPISMYWYQIHGMVVQSDRAAWIVREGKLAPVIPKTSGLAYSLLPQKLIDSTGMYLTMPANEAQKMCKDIWYATLG